jgi:hypothetical protein
VQDIAGTATEADTAPKLEQRDYTLISGPDTTPRLRLRVRVSGQMPGDAEVDDLLAIIDKGFYEWIVPSHCSKRSPTPDEVRVIARRTDVQCSRKRHGVKIEYCFSCEGTAIPQLSLSRWLHGLIVGPTESFIARKKREEELQQAEAAAFAAESPPRELVRPISTKGLNRLSRRLRREEIEQSDDRFLHLVAPDAPARMEGPAFETHEHIGDLFDYRDPDLEVALARGVHQVA